MEFLMVRFCQKKSVKVIIDNNWANNAFYPLKKHPSRPSNTKTKTLGSRSLQATSKTYNFVSFNQVVGFSGKINFLTFL